MRVAFQSNSEFTWMPLNACFLFLSNMNSCWHSQERIFPNWGMGFDHCNIWYSKCPWVLTGNIRATAGFMNEQFWGLQGKGGICFWFSCSLFGFLPSVTRVFWMPRRDSSGLLPGSWTRVSFMNTQTPLLPLTAFSPQNYDALLQGILERGLGCLEQPTAEQQKPIIITLLSVSPRREKSGVRSGHSCGWNLGLQVLRALIWERGCVLLFFFYLLSKCPEVPAFSFSASAFQSI